VGRVIEGLVARICIGLPNACASLDDDAAEAMYGQINETHSAVALLQNPAYSGEWHDSLAGLCAGPTVHGLVAGRASRLLLDAAVVTGSEAVRGMSLAFSSEPSYAGPWMEGFLRGSGLLLLHDEALWDVIDRWVCDLPPPAFESLLPLLRRTFGGFSAPERRQMGDRVRHQPASAAAPPLSDAFDRATALQALAVVEQILGLAPAAQETQT
jgi:hypothetical protein